MAHPIHEAIRRLRERHQQNQQQMRVQLNEGQIAASNCFDRERQNEIAAADIPAVASMPLDDARYGELEREHFGDADKQTGIYAPKDNPVLATAGLRSKDFEPEKIIRAHAERFVEDQTKLLVETHADALTDEKYRTIEAYIKTYLHVTGADIRMLRLCERTSYRDGKIVIERWLESR